MIPSDKTQIMAGFFNHLIHVTSKQAFTYIYRIAGVAYAAAARGITIIGGSQGYGFIFKKNGRSLEKG